MVKQLSFIPPGSLLFHTSTQSYFIASLRLKHSNRSTSEFIGRSLNLEYRVFTIKYCSCDNLRFLLCTFFLKKHLHLWLTDWSLAWYIYTQLLDLHVHQGTGNVWQSCQGSLAPPESLGLVSWSNVNSWVSSILPTFQMECLSKRLSQALHM